LTTPADLLRTLCRAGEREINQLLEDVASVIGPPILIENIGRSRMELHHAAATS
jgi:hypothetical protein